MERQKKSAVAGLLDDHLVEILSRLPVKDLHRSKCVSKGWLDLITDPLHCKKLPQTLQGFFRSSPLESPNQSGGSFVNLFGESPPPIDPSLPFLKKLPGIRNIFLMRSCNGLLLFRHHTSLRLPGYIVFNPAVEQWAAVPTEDSQLYERGGVQHSFLVFHPAASSHFHLVIFCEEERDVCTVHSYSSKTGVWKHSPIDWAEELKQRGQLEAWVPQIRGLYSHATVLNGMLYLILTGGQIAEVDVEGKTQRIILAPSSMGRRSGRHHPIIFYEKGYHPIFIGQSQGRLHCVYGEVWVDDIPSELSSRVYTRDSDDDSYLLSVWVLEDNDTQKWVHKHSVSYARLFGSRLCNYNVAAIHPDSNLVYIVLFPEWQLISYGLDRKEVCVICTIKNFGWPTPYVPCFLDFVSVAEHDEKLKGGRKANVKDDGESSGQ